MLNVDRAYILVAFALALVGMLVGYYMGVTGAMQLRGFHIALVLQGFVTLAIFGFIFRSWPALKKSRLAAPQYWIMIVGTLATIVGAYFFSLNGSVALAALGAALMIVATAMLAWMFWSEAPETA